MKNRLIIPLFLLLLFLSACARADKPSVITKPKTEEKDPRETFFTTEEETPVTTSSISSTTTQTVFSGKTENPVPATSHVHQWTKASVTEASCVANGLIIFRCSCGDEREEVLLSIPHDYVSGGCGNRFRCKNCGGAGELAPHRFEKNACSLCGLTVNSPVFVHNTQLDFDENVSSILQKMGNPTEILNEGELKSLVYASDLATLTVVQTDSVGLWGVFTLDPTAFFYVDGQVIKAEGFSGKPDTQSDTSYREIDSCRIYGFRDQLGTRQYYGMWMRYTECEYHYLTDPRIVQDYGTQERLSFYFVNGLRAINGLAPLQWSDRAALVSREYSQKMATENFFAHDNLYGNRLNAAGVVWRSCGENVSQGYTSSFFVCDAYYNCEDHRNNILNPTFTHVGMGYAMQTDGTYPVTVLGTQTFYS